MSSRFASHATRALGAGLAMALLTACPRDDNARGDTGLTVVPVDTTPTDLSQLQSNIPEAAPDTFRRRTAADLERQGGGTRSAPRYADAPEALLTAVQREQAFTRFCYQEFGQKVDPGLTGGVSMVVTVANTGVTAAEVGNSRWSSTAPGRAVERCIEQKAKQAWRLEPGAVRPGRYVVPLTFRGS